MREFRGISIAYYTSGTEIKLTTRGERSDDYEHLIFPSTLPLNRGQIIKFLGDHYNLPPGEIKWAAHVKIPGE